MKWHLWISRLRYALSQVDPMIAGWAIVTIAVAWAAWMSR